MRKHSKSGLNFNRRRVKVSNDTMMEILKYITGICGAVGLAFFLVFCWGNSTRIIGSSMEPSLSNGQIVLVSKLSYIFLKPRIGDVVVFLPNGNQNTHYYIKRVVATPGDKVEIKSGILYVNDEPEKEATDKIADSGILDSPLTLGDDEYFVLGDNRNNSEDSRSGNIGPVNISLIEGRVWFKLEKSESGTGFMNRKMSVK
ncbi:MAG: signal peptidase I [Lachnospiraceae bacterium]|nr:signal peptidase I [Lachnospiraceae bacterium]